MILISNDELKTDVMDKYEKETGKKAIWHGQITKSFKKWKKGEKIYIDDKERIVILVTESIKTNWQEFAKKNNIQTISKLIRDSVEFYMNIKTKLTCIGDKEDMVDLSDDKPLFCGNCGEQLYTIDEIADRKCNNCRKK